MHQTESVDTDANRLGTLLLEAQKQSLEMVVRGAPLAQVLTYLAEVVERFSEGHSVAAILLVDHEARLWTAAAPSLPPEYTSAIDGLRCSPHLGTCSVAAATGAAVITPDIAADPKWAGIAHLPLGGSRSGSVDTFRSDRDCRSSPRRSLRRSASGASRAAHRRS